MPEFPGADIKGDSRPSGDRKRVLGNPLRFSRRGRRCILKRDQRPAQRDLCFWEGQAMGGVGFLAGLLLRHVPAGWPVLALLLRRIVGIHSLRLRPGHLHDHLPAEKRADYPLAVDSDEPLLAYLRRARRLHSRDRMRDIQPDFDLHCALALPPQMRAIGKPAAPARAAAFA